VGRLFAEVAVFAASFAALAVAFWAGRGSEVEARRTSPS